MRYCLEQVVELCFRDVFMSSVNYCYWSKLPPGRLFTYMSRDIRKKTSYQVKSMEKFSMKYQPSPHPWLTTLLHEIFTTLQFRELRVAIFRDFVEI